MVDVSQRATNANCSQETECFQTRNATNMLDVNTKSAFPSSKSFRSKSSDHHRPVLSVFLAWSILVTAFCISHVSVAQPTVSSPRTSMIIFADHPLSAGQWSSLSTAIRRELASSQAETQSINPNVEFIRGDSFVTGMQFDSPISVFLHGNCNPPLQPPGRYPARTPLGWVWRRQGTIEPFVNVDCTSIGQVMEPSIYWLHEDDRTSAMSEAIGRVIVHEWIHIATQSPAHTRNSISKAQVGVNYLIPDRDETSAHSHE